MENKERKKRFNVEVSELKCNEQLVCECGKKPKEVPNDGYRYICNKCKKLFAN